MLSEVEIELRLKKLEIEQDKKNELFDMLVRNVNEIETFRKQFRNGNGFVPKIIDGLTAKFQELFKEHKKAVKKEINDAVDRIPCSKLIGKTCDVRIIGKDDPIPKGYKELK